MRMMRGALARVSGALFVAASLARLSAQVGGPNVNMVSGQDWPDGDPYLQRQNEPSIAVSSRNDQHLMGAANDYRTVDLPGLVDKATGDAWLGIFKSFDGGQTWKSTLLPGYPQDTTAAGAASPLKGYDAGADPTVRAGANGLLHMSGIAFQRNAIVDSGAPGNRALAAESDALSSAERAQLKKASKARARMQAKDRHEREEAREARERQMRKAIEAKTKAEGRHLTRAQRRDIERQLEHEEQLAGGAEEDEDEEGAEAGVAGTSSTVFVSTFIDLNNRENGDPIRYVTTSLVDKDAGTRFLDKQWMAVDVPRANAARCTFNVVTDAGVTVPQSFPGGRIYVAYTAFTGSGSTQQGQILFSSSSDCGVTWRRPKDISTIPDPDVTNDGIVNLLDMNLVKASFGKRCGDTAYNPAADPNGDCLVDLLDLSFVSKAVGKTFPTASRVPQGASVVVNPVSGAVYIAWREFKRGGLPDVVKFAMSNDFGQTFTAPIVVATTSPFDQGTTNTSMRTSAFPTMVSDGTRLYLAWSARGFATTRQDPVTGDARIVMATSADGVNWLPPVAVDEPNVPGHQLMPALTFGGGTLSLLYYDLREDYSQLFAPYIDELPVLQGFATYRHTLDARIARGTPGARPIFTSARLSEYPFGALSDTSPVEQLQFNPPNLPIFRKGSAPFLGDYLDVVATPTMRVNPNGTWSFNIEPGTSTAGHAVWTDNRNVRAGPNGDLSNYTPPTSAAVGTMSRYDPTQPVPACVPNYTGTRNQDIYTARFDNGLRTSVLGNAKTLDPLLERAFALVVSNSTAEIRSYRLTIAGQPVGGHASFAQVATGGPIAPVLDVALPPYSSAARTVFVTSSDPAARIDIDVAEIGAPGDPTVLAGGLHGAVVLNPDPANPRLENPRLENPRLENPALVTAIQTSEFYAPLISTAYASPRLENPRLENPRLENPRLENLALANQNIVNPRLENPRLENPRLENSRLENPRLENPRLENTSLLNAALSETTWEITNAGNTAASFDVRLFLNQQVPAGFETQLIIYKIYENPGAHGCELLSEQNHMLVANIVNPAFDDPTAANPRLENPRLENATVALSPGETAAVLLRVFDPDKSDTIEFDASSSVTAAIVPQSVDTPAAASGVTTPPVTQALTITTPQLPDALTTAGAYSQQLTANATGTWSVLAGSLPPGLTLTAGGLLAGTPTTTGTFAFTLQFVDASNPLHVVQRDYVIRIGTSLAWVTGPTLDPLQNVAFSAPLQAAGGIGAYTWAVTAGTLPAGLVLDPQTGVIAGSATVPGTYPATITVTDGGNPANSLPQAFTIVVHATVGSPDLAVLLTPDATPVLAGTLVTYTIRVDNLSAVAAPTASARFFVPSSAVVQSLDSGCTQAGRVVTCQFAGGILDGAFATKQIGVDVNVGGVRLIAVAEVETVGETDLTSNTTSTVVDVTGTGGRQLWVANAGSGTVSVIDPSTNTVTSTLTLSTTVGDVAFSDDGSLGFVSVPGLDRVSRFDVPSGFQLTPLGATQADQLLGTTDGQLFVSALGSSSISAVDPTTGVLNHTYTAGTDPLGMAGALDASAVYVANRTSDTVSVLDPATGAIVATIPLNTGDFPVDLTLSPNGKKLYVVNHFGNSITVIDTATRTITNTIAIGSGPQGIAISPDGQRLYVSDFDDDAVLVIDAATESVITSIVVPGSPNGVVASPDGTAVYVTAYNGGNVAVIDTSTNLVVATISVGSLPVSADYVRFVP